MSIPAHIAIIMDGNGRWATKKKMPKIYGHAQGVKTVDRMTEECANRGIKALTLYSFSAENWKRPKEEVDALMDLFRENLKSKSDKINSNNIRFNVIGRMHELSEPLQVEIARVIDLTSSNTGMILTLAINYGSRQEIFDAACKLAEDMKNNDENPADLKESDLEKHLYTFGLPELDLIIRTSGEIRLSNFLLWQAAYSELYITETLWPDFDVSELDKAIEAFETRARRYGG
jgi:undecaprenyl diphosphate synthase